ncbi:hypothetical protein [Streptomyces sp. H39-S7]|uniref:hypothetical protein n=1 Tax=Streptomyces sp. H39-S7 TaxID=3004357 RepID=UPI0022AF781E|nr:hypothetical protein [Streptomyces sp. H39-S7]
MALPQPRVTGHASRADVASYTHTPAGKPAPRTDVTAKNIWTYGYDLCGRQITVNDRHQNHHPAGTWWEICVSDA